MVAVSDVGGTYGYLPVHLGTVEQNSQLPIVDLSYNQITEDTLRGIQGLNRPDKAHMQRCFCLQNTVMLSWIQRRNQETMTKSVLQSDV